MPLSRPSSPNLPTTTSGPFQVLNGQYRFATEGAGFTADMVASTAALSVFTNHYLSGSTDTFAGAGFGLKAEYRADDGSIRFSSTAAAGAVNTAITYKELLRLLPNGIIAQGIAANTWVSYVGTQFGSGSSLVDGVASTGISRNWYNDGTDRYIFAGPATRYTQASGQHAWYNAPGGSIGGAMTLTLAMQITPAGLVGIGVPNPVNVLDVARNQNAVSAINLANPNTGTFAGASVSASNGTNNVAINITSTGYAAFGMNRADGASLSSSGAGGLSIFSNNAQPVYFGTNFVERMRLALSGNLLLGTTADNAVDRLQINGSVSGTIFKASGMARVQAVNNSGQTIPGGVVTVTTNWASVFDATGSFNAATGVFTSPLTAYYLVTAQLGFSGSVAIGALFQVAFQINGANGTGGSATASSTAVTQNFASVSYLAQIPAGQTLKITAFQSTTAGTSLLANVNYLSITQMP